MSPLIPAVVRLARGLGVALALHAGLAAAVPAAVAPAPAVAPGTATTPAQRAHAPLPSLPPRTVELDGTWNGQPFWARLLPPDAHFANHRVLQLSWAPPAPETIGGVHLVDCPFILLDDHARIIAWNGRDGMSQVEPLGVDGYRVSRELARGSGADAQPVATTRTIGGGRGWDLHLAPLLVALSWQAGTRAQVHLIDLYGDRAAELLQVHWDQDQVQIAGVAMLAVADEQGHLRSLLSPGGAVLLHVAHAHREGPP